MRKTYRLSIILFCAAILIIAFFWLRSCMKDDHIELGADTAIDSTPTQIQSIKAIGEWEFLSVSVEELADTVRKGILSNDELARIYYGTLRLGINTHQMEPGWLEADGDTVRLTLPKIGLLDHVIYGAMSLIVMLAHFVHADFLFYLMIQEAGFYELPIPRVLSFLLAKKFLAELICVVQQVVYSE